MAYIGQETKARLTPAIKAVCKKHGVKHTIAISNNCALKVTLTEGLVQFGDLADYDQWKQCKVNTYHVRTQFYGTAAEFLKELIAAMRGELWYNNSRAEYDYFEIAYYIRINIGRPNKPYVCTTLN